MRRGNEEQACQELECEQRMYIVCELGVNAGCQPLTNKLIENQQPEANYVENFLAVMCCTSSSARKNVSRHTGVPAADCE